MGDSTLAQVATSMISNGDKAPTRTGEARAENKPGGSKTSPGGDETWCENAEDVVMKVTTMAKLYPKTLLIASPLYN